MKKLLLLILFFVCALAVAGALGWKTLHSEPSTPITFTSVSFNELPDEAISLFKESLAGVYDVYRSPKGPDYVRFICGDNTYTLLRIEQKKSTTAFYVKPASLQPCKERYFRVNEIRENIEFIIEEK